MKTKSEILDYIEYIREQIHSSEGIHPKAKHTLTHELQVVSDSIIILLEEKHE